jgi:predicted AAA+ superfamily ATPase
MISQKALENVLIDQKKVFLAKDRGIKREIDLEKYLKTKQITVISGIRRSGKSTFLSQIADNYKGYHYLNFDDERLVDFSVKDFSVLMSSFLKMSDAKVIFLDEIQNVRNWERFVRRIFEEGYKIFITGSNARLLSSELATHLTGRYVKIEMFPFSFVEYLNLKNISFQEGGTKAEAKIKKAIDEYLLNGGFPEYSKSGDKESLKRIYGDIMYRDLITRFKIRETKAFRELANYLFTNFSKELSYNSLKNILGFKSVMSVKNYVDFMEQSYLIFELFKYDFSLKKQYVSDKKIYVIDNGLRNEMAFNFSHDEGRLLENLVFIELRRRQMEIFYYKDKKECDFLIKDKNKIVSAIQVTKIFDKYNRERELAGLEDALEKFNLKQGLILTIGEEEEIKIKKKKIKILPVWKWLIEN